MNLKTTMVGAALSLSMMPLAARADGWNTGPQAGVQVEVHAGYQTGYQGDSQGEAAVQYPSEPPRGHHRRGGRYEMRTTQQWVPGRYQQVWVPEQCSTRERQRGWWRQAGTVCVPGHYDQRWVPAHSEAVRQWVWVPYAHGRHHFGRR